MKKIFLFVAMCLSFMAINAQNTNARAVLDKTAATIRNAGGIKADFMASSTSGSMSGTVYIHKNMLHMTSANVKCWFNGKTLWTYQKRSNEINITTPTAAEQQSINPYLFINIYKSGFDYSLKEVALKGQRCYQVTLTATSATNKLRAMVITIDKSNYFPLSVRMDRQKGGVTTIYINNCHTNQHFSASIFRFNSKEYPDAEIIDLR